MKLEKEKIFYAALSGILANPIMQERLKIKKESDDMWEGTMSIALADKIAENAVAMFSKEEK